MALTDTQRKQLEARLQEERARALRALNRNVEEDADETDEQQSGDLTSMPTHMADRGTSTMQEELDASNATRISRELAEIDAALDRLIRTPHAFGKCEETGEWIPFARLEIIPWARTCSAARA